MIFWLVNKNVWKTREITIASVRKATDWQVTTKLAKKRVSGMLFTLRLQKVNGEK